MACQYCNTEECYCQYYRLIRKFLPAGRQATSEESLKLKMNDEKVKATSETGRWSEMGNFHLRGIKACLEGETFNNSFILRVGYNPERGRRTESRIEKFSIKLER